MDKAVRIPAKHRQQRHMRGNGETNQWISQDLSKLVNTKIQGIMAVDVFAYTGPYSSILQRIR
eukprot:scaffold248723_cov20-Tisochrysis_lutea.AAC.1